MKCPNCQKPMDKHAGESETEEPLWVYLCDCGVCLTEPRITKTQLIADGMKQTNKMERYL